MACHSTSTGARYAGSATASIIASSRCAGKRSDAFTARTERAHEHQSFSTAQAAGRLGSRRVLVVAGHFLQALDNPLRPRFGQLTQVRYLEPSAQALK